MKSFSFIIPVRIDNKDRYENLESCLKYIRRYFKDSEIIVVENSSKSEIKELLRNFEDIKYVFMKNEKEFSRSRTINAGAMVAERDFLVIYDLDVLIHPLALNKCAKILSKGHIKIILPHNTIFINVAGETKRRIIESLDTSSLPRISTLNVNLTNPDLNAYPIPSGVIIFEREIFLSSGGFNKNMTSYGWEDIEVLKRMSKLGHYPHILGKYNIIHMDHQRGSDSVVNEYYSRNKAEFLKIAAMSKKEVKCYIESNLAMDLPSKIKSVPQNHTHRKQVKVFQMIFYFWNLALHHLKVRGFAGTLSYVIHKF